MNIIKHEMEALSVAVKIVDAQEKLLIAYRVGGRTPAAAIDYLTKHRPRLDEWRERSLRTANRYEGVDKP